MSSLERSENTGIATPAPLQLPLGSLKTNPLNTTASFASFLYENVRLEEFSQATISFVSFLRIMNLYWKSPLIFDIGMESVQYGNSESLSATAFVTSHAPRAWQSPHTARYSSGSMCGAAIEI